MFLSKNKQRVKSSRSIGKIYEIPICGVVFLGNLD